MSDELRNLLASRIADQSVRGTPSTYHTGLTPPEEGMFQAWLAKNKVPFDPGQQSDYDMRGFYRGLLSGDPRATSAVDPNDGRMHYPDHWKTPYHQTFSNQSQWATQQAPAWNEQDQLIGPAGRVVFDDRQQKGPF